MRGGRDETLIPLSASAELPSSAHPPIFAAAGFVSIGVHVAIAAVLLTHGPAVVDTGIAIPVEFVIEDSEMPLDTKGAAEKPATAGNNITIPDRRETDVSQIDEAVKTNAPVTATAPIEQQMLEVGLAEPARTVEPAVDVRPDSPTAEATENRPAPAPSTAVIEARREADAAMMPVIEESQDIGLEVAKAEDTQKRRPVLMSVLPRRRPTPPATLTRMPIVAKTRSRSNIEDPLTDRLVPAATATVSVMSDVHPVADQGGEITTMERETASISTTHRAVSVGFTAAAAGANPRPRYPAAALARGIEGRVLLSVEVRADGGVGIVNVVQSSGHRLLDAAAVRAVSRWRFRPATRLGIAIADRVSIPIVFRLGD